MFSVVPKFLQYRSFDTTGIWEVPVSVLQEFGKYLLSVLQVFGKLPCAVLQEFGKYPHAVFRFFATHYKYAMARAPQCQLAIAMIREAGLGGGTGNKASVTDAELKARNIIAHVSSAENRGKKKPQKKDDARVPKCGDKVAMYVVAPSGAATTR